MAERQREREIIAELEAALDEDDTAEKNYHVREALQLLQLDESPDKCCS